MQAKVSSSVRCSDGTEIPFEWVYPEAPDFEWLRDKSHWPQPMAPLELWLFLQGNPGADRAWQEVEMVPPPTFHRFQMVGPFLYARMTMHPPERMAQIVPRYLEVNGQFGGALAFWQQYCMPRIQRSCDELSAMDPNVDLAAAAELWFYGFHQTFTCLPLIGVPNMRLTALLQEFVDDAELTSFEVTQGDENATQAIDGEIWQLAELARETPAVLRILESDGDDITAALRREPAARTFVEAFDALIARHARRSQGWTLMEETWGERPEAALALVRAEVGAEHVSPDELRERTARRRQEATERALAALPADKHDEFRGIVRALDGYVNIREGRAYWQMTICGSLRGLLLRLGAELVRAGRIDRAEDVMFMTPEQFEADATSDLRQQVAEGRAAWEHWRAIEPQHIIGTPGEVSTAAEAMRAELRGMPASRGVATGTARILHGPEEGSRLGHGDILVCVMTTPAWTPLFAIAGGIVTETGGALSHPAITAREYGIPAVVALQDATKNIRDGQTITIDGAKGTIVVSS